jgi:hypothetical protein
MTDFKTGVIVYKVATDYTHGRKGIVLDCDTNKGKSKVYWYKPNIVKWCSWNSLSLMNPLKPSVRRLEPIENVGNIAFEEDSFS